MPYLPIEDYGVIGDLQTVALCGVNGSIDWFCFPHFDSPSVFAALLDDKKGGRFQIAPTDPSCTYKQLYLPDTNVLVTRFLSADGVGEIYDFMPVERTAEEREAAHRLVRVVQVVRGAMRFRVDCSPRFDYGRAPHRAEPLLDGVRFRSPALTLQLRATVPLQIAGNDAVTELTLQRGGRESFVLEPATADITVPIADSRAEIRVAFNATVAFWRDWLKQSTYRGRWREMVNRSALVLKLLTFAPTGAIVAAPTTSLPEAIAGPRNWDYRYTWIRDASFTLYALLRIGFESEAKHFVNWLEARCQELEPDGALQIMYGIDGRHDLREEVLDHLEGYRGTGPVRIGNGATHQLHLDIYGELMDAVYLDDKSGEPISCDLWSNL